MVHITKEFNGDALLEWTNRKQTAKAIQRAMTMETHTDYIIVVTAQDRNSLLLFPSKPSLHAPLFNFPTEIPCMLSLLPSRLTTS